MSDDGIKVESHSNKVIGLDGKVQESSASIKFTRERKGKRPDSAGSALLQARHMYNEMEDVTDELVKKGMEGGVSYIQDHKYRFFKIQYYCYGLFWSTLLKALKNRKDLKEWSPEIFANDVECKKCKGEGKLLYKVGSKEYDESFESFKDFDAEFDEEPMKYGVDIGLHCTPCQGVGYIYQRGNK